MALEAYYIYDSPFGTIGYKLKCEKCGRGILVESVQNGSNHTIGIVATCLECVELQPEFREEHPEVCKKIDGWKKGS